MILGATKYVSASVTLHHPMFPSDKTQAVAEDLMEVLGWPEGPAMTRGMGRALSCSDYDWELYGAMKELLGHASDGIDNYPPKVGPSGKVEEAEPLQPKATKVLRIVMPNNSPVLG